MSASKRPGRWMNRHSTYPPIKQKRDIKEQKKKEELEKKRQEKRQRYLEKS